MEIETLSPGAAELPGAAGLESPQGIKWDSTADAVFRGGGVKGLGLAGALEVFAAHPRWRVQRWVNVAGASAGAIIASYIACNPTGDVGREMIGILDPSKLRQFQDFPLGGKWLGGVPRLLLKHGMAPGTFFERWFDEVLEGATFAQMLPAGSTAWQDSRLRLIACDVTNRRLLVLPEDLPDYRLPGTSGAIDPARFKIARAARMSMSIPYFFSPVVLERITDDEGHQLSKPRTSLIVDGGTLSNFPVWLFDDAHPKRPTFGFTLDGGSGVGVGFNRLAGLMPWPVRFGADIFHTAQDAWDVRFASTSTQVRTVVVDATVTVNGVAYPVNTTDFDLSEERQKQLVANGREAATTFLDGFDIVNYKNSKH
jgi:NTE family protein